jgi:hypothetical protein
MSVSRTASPEPGIWDRNSGATVPPSHGVPCTASPEPTASERAASDSNSGDTVPPCDSVVAVSPEGSAVLPVLTYDPNPIFGPQVVSQDRCTCPPASQRVRASPGAGRGSSGPVPSYRLTARPS